MSETKSGNSEVRDGQRIAKVIARAGLCSRRDAEAWIEAGRVSVNGAVLASPAYNVGPDDDVRVDGAPLPTVERTRLFFFHKPRGLVTTARDPEGRATIFDALPADLPRVVAVGRLDINTEGLLLLTNDGGLARVLELPATGWLRRYRVRAHGTVAQSQLDALREGPTIDGIHYAGIEARLERDQGSNVWIMMGLREGKNREIKRVLEHLGLSVNRLIRVSFGPFELGDLPEGAVAELNTRILRDQLGLKLAKQAGANFDAPIARAAPPPSPIAAPREGRRSGGDRPRPPARGREDRAEIARELASRGERRETVAPRKRKHVSALRAEALVGAEGPRKRIERSATSDRKGRQIAVERIMTAREPAPEPARVIRKRGEGGGQRERAPGGGREFRRDGAGSPRAAAAKRAPGEEATRSYHGAPRGRETAGGGASGGASRHAGPGRDRAPEGASYRSSRPSGEGRASEHRGTRPERSGPKRDFKKERDGGPARAGPGREGAPFRSSRPSGDGRASEHRGTRPERSGPKRDFKKEREGGPARSGSGRERGEPSAAGRPPRGGGGKPPGKRPPRRT